MPTHNSKREYFKLIVAVYLVLRKEDGVLLSKRANTGYQDGKFSMIAGHIDGDELATNAMAREASEEAGIKIDPAKLKLVHIAHRLSRGQSGQERMDLFFELREWEGDIKNLEPHKCAELTWFSLDKLPKNIIPFVGLVLNDIKQNVTYSEYETEPN
jgi:8-oxo-dGTP pyrophosphatase MutT (NUDIX family)